MEDDDDHTLPPGPFQVQDKYDFGPFPYQIFQLVGQDDNAVGFEGNHLFLVPVEPEIQAAAEEEELELNGLQPVHNLLEDLIEFAEQVKHDEFWNNLEGSFPVLPENGLVVAGGENEQGELNEDWRLLFQDLLQLAQEEGEILLPPPPLEDAPIPIQDIDQEDGNINGDDWADLLLELEVPDDINELIQAAKELNTDDDGNDGDDEMTLGSDSPASPSGYDNGYSSPALKC